MTKDRNFAGKLLDEWEQKEYAKKKAWFERGYNDAVEYGDHFRESQDLLMAEYAFNSGKHVLTERELKGCAREVVDELNWRRLIETLDNTGL
jgi:hypothetical protein